MSTDSPLLLRGGVAFITGAARGIGEAAAFRFAQCGASALAICDINLDSLEIVAQRLRTECPKVEVEPIYIDTGDEESIINAHEVCMKRFGRIDFAVNNAGVAGPLKSSVDLSREQFLFSLGINMVGVWLCQREQIKHMQNQERGPQSSARGTIVNLSSMYGHKCTVSNTAYGSSKHGVLGITKNDAVNYARDGIRINAVCPGFIETPMTCRPEGPSPGMRNYLATVPMARIGQPEEVADVILFLSSSLSRYITGTDIKVDGGFGPRGTNRSLATGTHSKLKGNTDIAINSPSQEQYDDMIDVQHQSTETLVFDAAPTSDGDLIRYVELSTSTPLPTSSNVTETEVSHLNEPAVSRTQVPPVLPLDEAHAAVPEDDLYFDSSFLDEATLDQYMDLADIGDPFNFYTGPIHHPVQDLSLTDGSCRSESVISPSADAICEFRSPLPWVRDWSLSHGNDDGRHTKSLKERAFVLPSSEEIRTAFMMYFTHLHPRLPVLREREFHCLLTNEQCEPISLALLYAILFAATPYLAAEGKRLAGYNSFVAATCDFYSRAALLLKLGCEENPLHILQICLILSTYRTHQNRDHENERYVVKTYELLVENHAFQRAANPNDSDQPSWKRVVICFMARAACLLIALKRTSKPEMFERFSSDLPTVSLDDFKDDYEFSWFLSAEAKKDNCRLFVSLFHLQMQVVPLGKLLVNRVALDTGNPRHSQVTPFAGEHLSIEDVELRIDEWKQENTKLLNAKPLESFSSADLKAFNIAQAFTKLSYEYFRSELYQTTLVMDRCVLTKWAVRLRESSRIALRESIAATVAIIESLVAKGLSGFLPPGSLCCVIIPLTVYHVHLKTTSTFDALMLEKLSMCAKVVHDLSRLHDPGRFFQSLMNVTLAVVERCRQQQGSQQQGANNPTDMLCDTDMDQTNVPLPGLVLHSRIIQFQNRAYADGIPESVDLVP